MKKGIKRISIGLLLVGSLTFPTLASAASWHGSTITLPRNGGWWLSTQRTAQGDTQGLKASKNKYQVIGNIVNKGNKTLGNWKTFGAYNKTAQYTQTYTKGSQIKAVFQTNAYNFKTTTTYLEWRP